MGFLGSIPAANLRAAYNVNTKRLTLYAEGVVMGATYGFNFRRDSFMGGLKFSLMAWTGPLTGKEQPYDFKQAFYINMPLPHFNNKTVLIETSNYPDGKEVEIEYLGLIQPGSNLTSAPDTEKAVDSAKDEAAVSLTQGTAKLNVLFKEPFNIEASCRVPEQGAVKIDYDDTILELVTAGIDDKNIVWTFNSLKTGDTQIVVTTYGGIAKFVASKTYDVRIFVL
jgi:hypothetical protein